MNNHGENIFSRDELYKMSDDNLQTMIRQMRGRILDARKKKRPTHPLEVELCYLQGELERRSGYFRTSVNR
jgi:hypothetical protein